METVPSVSAPLISLSLFPCDPLPSPPQNLKFARKPPCSPPRPTKPTQDPPQYSPSPTKRRSDNNKENFFVVKNSNEIKLFSNSPPTKLPFNKNLPSSTNIKKSSKIRTKNTINNSFTQYSPQLKIHSNKNFNFSSFLSPYKKNLSVDSKKIRVFTPVLYEKKRKTPEVQEFCQKISLFESKVNKNFISADTCSTFKDQSTRIEDSTTMGEITPIKHEDILRDEVNDFSFNSPLNTIRVLNSPEEGIITPEAKIMTTPERKLRGGDEFLAPKKEYFEFLTPESNVFVLSSSSEVISEASFCDEIQPSFGDISVVPGNKGIDKEMQTDADLKKVLDILGNQEVIDGLKMIGKFKEILRIINNN